MPERDAGFVGFYISAPDSAITHIGVVERVERDSTGATFFLKAIIKLDAPVRVDHPIRKHEYWTLERLGVKRLALLINGFARVGGSN